MFFRLDLLQMIHIILYEHLCADYKIDAKNNRRSNTYLYVRQICRRKLTTHCQINHLYNITQRYCSHIHSGYLGTAHRYQNNCNNKRINIRDGRYCSEDNKQIKYAKTRRDRIPDQF